LLTAAVAGAATAAAFACTFVCICVATGGALHLNQPHQLTLLNNTSPGKKKNLENPVACSSNLSHLAMMMIINLSHLAMMMMMMFITRRCRSRTLKV
jgi:hypothetical protein